VTALDLIQHHLREMNDWIDGKRSWCNLGWNEPYTPDVIAGMDAAEVQKHAAAVTAYASLVGLGMDLSEIGAGHVGNSQPDTAKDTE
jgi:hypothetical protein